MLVWDTEKNKRLEIEDIVDLLNELYERMKRFGEHSYKLEQYNLHYLNENTRLKEENDKLRQDRKVANDFIVKKGLDIEYYKYWRGLQDE